MGADWMVRGADTPSITAPELENVGTNISTSPLYRLFRCAELIGRVSWSAFDHDHAPGWPAAGGLGAWLWGCAHGYNGKDKLLLASMQKKLANIQKPKVKDNQDPRWDIGYSVFG